MWRNRQVRRKERGFTLVELIIVMGMLVVVLGVTYRIILDVIETDRTVERLTLPEKIGEGILALLRTDLAGTIYRQLGRRVFFVTDSGFPPEARDELRFLTTTEPTPMEEAESSTSVSVQELRTILGVAYFLRPSRLEESVPAQTLFRKEMVELDPTGPVEGPGLSFEVYDKICYFNVECFDGWSWYQDWDSEQRILAEENELAAEEAAGQGQVARVSDPKSRDVAGITEAGVDPYATGEYEELLPPAAVPVAVRFEVGVYVSVSGRLLRDAQGNPVVKSYSTIVPILVSQRVRMDFEDELGAEQSSLASGEGGVEGEGAAAGGRGFNPRNYKGGEGRGGERGMRPGGGREGGMGPGGGRMPPGGGGGPGGGRGRQAGPGGAAARPPGGAAPPGGSGGAPGRARR